MSQALLRRRALLLDELHQIVTAMRNMSVAALQRLGKAAEVEQEALRLLTQALADMNTVLPPVSGAGICLVIGSERGFCGGFNSRIAEFSKRHAAEHPGLHFYAAGSRLVPLLENEWPQLNVLNGCADMEDASSTVSGWLSAVLPSEHNWPPLTLIYHDDGGVKARSLLPLPPLPKPGHGPAPLRYLDAAPLMAGFVSEWLRLSLLNTLTTSLTTEHHWRLNQMQRADRYLEEAGIKLRGRMQRQRQNEITVELENLMSALDVG
ncbi:MAG TPA: F0F1 ATP synthase subunit gamma [Candidatus Kapabacteria bacterium]|nr:F0F1 ATP synthase subunit gamma [Candidatus Kapabacteria bacterium]